VPWSATAIGANAAGTVSETDDNVTLQATGGDIYKKADSLFYRYLLGEGDLDLRVRLAGWETGDSNTAKAGLMIRGCSPSTSPAAAGRSSSSIARRRAARRPASTWPTVRRCRSGCVW